MMIKNLKRCHHLISIARNVLILSGKTLNLSRSKKIKYKIYNDIIIYLTIFGQKIKFIYIYILQNFNVNKFEI